MNFTKLCRFFIRQIRAFFYEIIIRGDTERGRTERRGHLQTRKTDISLGEADIGLMYSDESSSPELLHTYPHPRAHVHARLVPGQVLIRLSYPKIETKVIDKKLKKLNHKQLETEMV